MVFGQISNDHVQASNRLSANLKKTYSLFDLGGRGLPTAAKRYSCDSPKHPVLSHEPHPEQCSQHRQHQPADPPRFDQSDRPGVIARLATRTISNGPRKTFSSSIGSVTTDNVLFLRSQASAADGAVAPLIQKATTTVDVPATTVACLTDTESVKMRPCVGRRKRRHR